MSEPGELTPNIDRQIEGFIGGHNELLTRLIQGHIKKTPLAIAEDYWLEVGRQHAADNPQLYDPEFVSRYPYEAMVLFRQNNLSLDNPFILWVNSFVNNYCPFYLLELYEQEKLDPDHKVNLGGYLRERLRKFGRAYSAVGPRIGLPSEQVTTDLTQAVQIHRTWTEQVRKDAGAALRSIGDVEEIDKYLTTGDGSVWLDRCKNITQFTANLLGVSGEQLARAAAVYQEKIFVYLLKAFIEKGYILKDVTKGQHSVITTDRDYVVMKTVLVSSLSGIFVFGHELPPIIDSPSPYFLKPMYEIASNPSREYVYFHHIDPQEEELHNTIREVTETLDFPVKDRLDVQRRYSRGRIQFDAISLSPGCLFETTIFHPESLRFSMDEDPKKNLRYLLPISVAVLQLPPRAIVK